MPFPDVQQTHAVPLAPGHVQGCIDRDLAGHDRLDQLHGGLIA